MRWRISITTSLRESDGNRVRTLRHRAIVPIESALGRETPAKRRYASTISDRLGRSVGVNKSLPEGIKVHEAEPLTVQKSAFVGRACKLDNAAQVGVSLPCQYSGLT